MQSKEFLCDLGLLYDALSELANLSRQLQVHSIMFLRADQLLKRTIRVINNMEKHLSFKGEMLRDLSVLYTDNWPSTPGIRHGCQTLSISEMWQRVKLGDSATDWSIFSTNVPLIKKAKSEYYLSVTSEN